MSKTNGGFSYMEILIALALFAIVLVAVLPTLLQAGRNLEYAKSYYNGRLTAQEILLTVRDAIVNDDDICDAIAAHALLRGVEHYRIWVIGEYEEHFYSIDAPQVALTLTNTLIPIQGHNSTIIVAIWNSDNHLTGRAYGVVNHRLEDSHAIQP